MGWWGPGIFDGDTPLDLYSALVDTLGIGELIVDDEFDVHELPPRWSDEQASRVGDVDDLADTASAWALQLRPTEESIRKELARTVRHELDLPPSGDGWHNVSRGLAAELGSPVVDALEPAAKDALAAKIVEAIARSETLSRSMGEWLIDDHRYACQVATATLMAAGVELPEPLRTATLDACENDPWADGNPARRAEVEGFAALVESYDASGPVRVSQRSLAEAFELADEAGHTLVNLPGSNI